MPIFQTFQVDAHARICLAPFSADNGDEGACRALVLPSVGSVVPGG